MNNMQQQKSILISEIMSQDEKNTDVTPGMQNCSVYQKSN